MAASKEDADALCDMLAPSEERHFDKLAGCEWGMARKKRTAL